ncbi:hypothetical protein P7C70_g93, partial [Phenoliferia sp. Uapishka_3]
MDFPVNRASDAFRLLRIRLLRPPPATIHLPSRGGTFSLELAVGFTDDYGGHADTFSFVKLKLSIIDSKTSHGLANIKVAIDGHPDPSNILLTTDRGPFHQLKITITTMSQPQAYPKKIRFSLALAPPEERSDAVETLGKDSMRMLEVVGEPNQQPLEGWDERRYIFLPVKSGDVELLASPTPGMRKGLQLPPTDKVQTVLRSIHLPDYTDTPVSFTVVERPGLNNSTGSRLWDCAVGISTFLSLHPSALYPPKTQLDMPPNSKRPRLSSSTGVTCLELGAGCALTSLVAASLLQSTDPSSTIIASDIEATHSTTLKENLNANLVHGRKVHPAVLQWGILTADDASDFLAAGDDLRKTKKKSLTILGSDILYDPDTHQLLLDTLLSFFQLEEVVDYQALIAYKPRTEGDQNFFPLAEKAGLVVEKVWAWGEMSVYRLTMSM